MQEEWRGKIGRTYEQSEPWLEPAKNAPEGAPNVVVIVLDDVGFAHLGCYGSTIETPNIDKLAAGGRRYNNFHTTAMCSPTRASLLTGREHHAVGMGLIADMGTGYPGYNGQVSNRAATLAELLQPAGYSTFAVGNWHLTRARDMTAAGPFGQWPLGRGFERYYGFLYSLMDHWHPELVSDNHFISPPNHHGYHLSEDLSEQTIGMIRDQQAVSPERPFFAYLAFGACHSPHHAPRAYIDKYKGRFDEGWDVMRERWLTRQIELGVVPVGTKLTARNERVCEWDLMSEDERRICARHQEVFAGFLDHTDHQIGRVIDYLAARDLLDNTMIVLLSDNGASAEGGALGNLNLRRHFQFIDGETLEQHLAALDQLGSEHHWNNYPAGWGHAGNSPHKWFKMMTHGGGVRDPMIVHWPARIRQGGGVSEQFCHCTDIVPTVLEAVGISAPTQVKGFEQMPIHGTSITYTFDEPAAPTRKRVQYFELMGNRGIWADGWKAVTRHEEGDDYEKDRWELYHLDSDFSEDVDLAEDHPEKLRELIVLWETEAERHMVFPLDDRNLSRMGLSYFLPARTSWRFEQGMTRVSGYAAPRTGNRSYRIIADVDLAEDTQGVILSIGGRAGGYVLYVKAGRLVHEYIGPDRRWILESQKLPLTGRHKLTLDFLKTGECEGVARLICDGVTIGEQTMRNTWPHSATGGGVCCGYDEASPLSDSYTQPFAFTGAIHGVTIETDGDYEENLELENHIALSED